MPQENVIAMRYAKGLAEEAASANRMDEVRRDFDLLAEIFDRTGSDPSVNALLDFLSAPTISDEDKCRTAAAIAEKSGIGKLVSDFLGVLIRHRRYDLVPAIYSAFLETADALTGDKTATVRTAMPLTEDQERRLADALATLTGAKIWLRQIIEPGLLAGMKISVGDRSFDGTVRGKLDRMGRALAERALADTKDLGDEESETAAREEGTVPKLKETRHV